MAESMTDHFRQEHKFQISYQSLQMLRFQLAACMRPDPHAGPDGGYTIRSLYFDDRDHTAFWEKLNGEYERSKFRMRYYNFNADYIVLEKKERIDNLCRKTSCRINRETALRLAQGLPSGGGEPLLDEFDALRSRGLKPAILVDYHRYAFSHPVSDVRVTLDSRLRTPLHNLDFFDPHIAAFPVFEDDEALIELKYDEYAPAYITRLLSQVPNVKIAVSKYTRCLELLSD